MATNQSPLRAWWQARGSPLLGQIVDFLLPVACVSCYRPGALFCDACYQSLTWLHDPLCPRCGRPTKNDTSAHCQSCRRVATPLCRVRAVVAYEGPVRPAIHAFKYEGFFAVAEPLASLLTAAWPVWPTPIELVIPVPLHPERERERGYNQATLLVEHLCDQLALTMTATAMQRTRHTRPQVGLDRDERVENVRDAFAADADQINGKHLLLVDDVTTTGATMAAAARALLSAGARSVCGYCVARAV